PAFRQSIAMAAWNGWGTTIATACGFVAASNSVWLANAGQPSPSARRSAAWRLMSATPTSSTALDLIALACRSNTFAPTPMTANRVTTACYACLRPGLAVLLGCTSVGRMGNAVVYFEVGAADEAALKRFYAELFDWQIEPFGGNYSSIDTRAGSGINGGIGRSSDGTPWASFYVEVDDPQVVLDKAASLGGKTVVPVTEIPNVLSWAMLSDPDGLLIGLFKSSGALRLQPSVGSGAPIDWFEVLGSDGERTRAFYSNLFGWQAGGAGPYLMVDTGAGRGIQ